MAVADVFDAITSIREYRDPADPDEVLELLKKESGKHFAPECVAAFERYYKRTGLGHRIRERNKKDLEDRKIESLL
jgi:HD-GYP domain-containing protein (c-di-GMP phosphodiesterase class II)